MNPSQPDKAKYTWKTAAWGVEFINFSKTLGNCIAIEYKLVEFD